LKYRKRGGKRFAGMVWSRKEDKETKEKKIFFGCTAQPVGSNLHPLHWGPGVLTTA